MGKLSPGLSYVLFSVFLNICWISAKKSVPTHWNSLSKQPSPFLYLQFHSWFPSGPFYLPHCCMKYFLLKHLSHNSVCSFKALLSLSIHLHTNWGVWDPSIPSAAYPSGPIPLRACASLPLLPPLMPLTRLQITTDSSAHCQTLKSKSSLSSPWFYFIFNPV